MIFGTEDVPLMSHAMIAEVQELTAGHVALGSGQVDPEKFSTPCAVEFHL